MVVKDFSVIALSLTRLLRKRVMYEWEGNCEQRIQQLKYFLTHARILVILEDSGNHKFLVMFLEWYWRHVDANVRVIAYVSRQMESHEMNYPTGDLEVTIIILAVKL